MFTLTGTKKKSASKVKSEQPMAGNDAGAIRLSAYKRKE